MSQGVKTKIVCFLATKPMPDKMLFPLQFGFFVVNQSSSQGSCDQICTCNLFDVDWQRPFDPRTKTPTVTSIVDT